MTGYPGALDTNPTVVTAQTVSSTNWNLLGSGVDAVQVALGINPFGSYATVAAALAGKLDLAGNTMTGAIAMGNNKITNLATPTTSTDAATKGYVDAAALGAITIHVPVRLCSTSNVATLSGLLTIDGVTTNSGDRVLLVGQTTGSQNGLYAAASGAWSRTTDANSVGVGAIATGLYVLVTAGSTQAGYGYALVTTGTIVLGTTTLTFNQYNQPGTGGASSGANNNITSMVALTGALEAPTQVSDVNGNAVLKFASTTTAVNSVSVQNAATGNGPIVLPSGSDTNINLNLNAQGTGIVALGASAQITANGSEGLLIKGSLTNVGVLPTTISGLVVWLKADAITGFTSGSALTSWADSSGVGNTATAPSGTAPTYYTNKLNGLPVVTFDGTDDFLTLTTALTTVLTVFWVCREVPSAPPAGYVFRPFLGGSGYDFNRGANNGAYWGVNSANQLNGTTYLNGAVVATPGVTAFPQGPFEIVSVICSANSTAHQIGQYTSDTGWNWYGDMAEIIIYNVALTSTQRSNIEAYLATKYALPLNVSTGPNLFDVRDPGNNPVFVVTANGGQQVKTNIILSGSSYAATLSDYVIIINKTTGSATTVNLPSTPGVGQIMTIKDGKGDAATNNITITPASGTIDGGTSVVMSTNYGVSRLIYNGSQWNSLQATAVPEFSAAVIEHFTHPRHSRPIAYPDGVGWVKRSENRFMQIQVVLKENRIDAIAFGTYGCAPSIACGSYVCEWAYGDSPRRARTLTVDSVLDALGGLPEHRRYCAEMAIEALHQALDNAAHNQSPTRTPIEHTDPEKG